MSNKRIGNKTENLYLQKVKDNGGWATLIPSGYYGQPFDTVAVLKDEVIFADIKHCSSESFNFRSNIQTNQNLSMQILNEVGNKNIKIGFVIYFKKTKSFHWLDYNYYITLKENGKKALKHNEIVRL